MAQRRMFSQKVTETDKFLDMGLTAQSLYFHLGMNADDDGFVGNPKSIKRMIGASEDDLKALVEKDYLIVFEDGVVVIKDWLVSNYVKKDRYTPTIYTDDMKLISLDKNKRYQFVSDLEPRWNQNGDKMEPECIQSGSKNENQILNENSQPQHEQGFSSMEPKWNQNGTEMDPQVRGRGRLEEELGKDRLEEDEDEEKHHPSSSSKLIDNFIAIHQISFSEYQIKKLNEFKQQLNDERLIVYAMQEAMSNNNDPKVELPFSYLVKILSRYVQEHVTYESLQAKIANNFRKTNKESMPEWSRKPKEELYKKADIETVRKLKERIANRQQ